MSQSNNNRSLLKQLLLKQLTESEDGTELAKTIISNAKTNSTWLLLLLELVDEVPDKLISKETWNDLMNFYE